MFSIVTLEQSNKRWRGHILLAKKLDYEQRDGYQLVLEAFVSSINEQYHPLWIPAVIEKSCNISLT